MRAQENPHEAQPHPFTDMIHFRLILVALIWGINFSVVKFALADFHPLSFTVVRFALATIFLFSLMRLKGESAAIHRQDRFAVFLLGFIGITLYNLFFMYGINYTTASNSALFISTSPVFAAVLLAFFRSERITAEFVAGLVLSSCGVFLIIQSGPGGLSFTRRGAFGDLLTLCAAVFWALYTIQSKPLLGNYSALKVTAYSMASGTVVLLPIGAPEMLRQNWEAISSASWAALAFSTFLSGGLAFTLWYQGVQKIGVSRTIVYHYLVPFIAVLFAALFLREQISALQVIGGTGIVGGVALVQKSRRKDGRKPAEPTSSR